MGGGCSIQIESTESTASDVACICWSSMLTMGSGGGSKTVMVTGCACEPECVCVPSGTFCNINGGRVTDSGVGIGGGGPMVCLVCSLSVLGGSLTMVFTMPDTVW